MQDNVQKNNGGSKADIIKDDLASLKDDTMTLAQDIRGHGGAAVREGLDRLRSSGRDEFHRVEKYVSEKPGQSILLAFGAGLIASYILRSRR